MILAPIDDANCCTKYCLLSIMDLQSIVSNVVWSFFVLS